MEKRLVQLDEMQNVLYRLRCVYDTLLLIHGQTLSNELYCAADELMHITDEFSDFLEESVADTDTP